MTERLAGRRVTAADEGDDGHLRHVARDEGGGLFFVRAPDLAADHQGPGLRVVLELAQALDEGRADNRVAADADAGRLTEPRPRQQVDDLVGEGSRAGDDPDVALFEDVARHDTEQGLAG